MDDHLLLFLVLFPLLSVGGIALIWVGLSSNRKARNREKRECTRVSGTVVDMVKHLSLGRGKPLITWHPVVEFTVEGQNLRHESRTGCRSEQIRIGECIDILYDADDPSYFHLEKQFEWEATGNRVIVVVGILWILVASIIAFIVSHH